MQQKTHLKTSNTLVGTVISIEENKATVQLKMTEEMAVDTKGLAHGGFTFGLADYAAMVATNQPNVVLGKAEVKFINPTVVGDLLTAEAVISEKFNAVKSAVTVKVKNQNNVAVFEGEFICFALENHVLQN